MTLDVGLVPADGHGHGKRLSHDIPFFDRMYDGWNGRHSTEGWQGVEGPHARRGEASTYRAPVRGSVCSPTCQPAFSSVAAQARSASASGSRTATASGCGVARTR